MSLITFLRHNITKTPVRIPLIWLRHRGITKNDVLIASYPRSGSTWLRFLLYEVLTGQDAWFDKVNFAIPRPGWHSSAPALLNGKGRLIQTHEAYREEYHKAIYLVRNVKGVVLSEFSYSKGRGVYFGELDAFVNAFVRGRVNGYRSWGENVASWLDSGLSLSEHLYLLKYEDLRKDPDEQLTIICRFLGHEVSSRAITAAIQNNTIEKMKQKEERARSTVFKKWKQDQRFVRHGATSGWQNELTTSQLQLLETTFHDVLYRLGYLKETS